MPIYEYVCEACGRPAEVMQKVGEPPPATCSDCGHGPLARLVSRTSFQLRGGGWYSDLYGSAKPKPAESPATAPAPAPTGGPLHTGAEGAGRTTGGSSPPVKAPAPSPPAPKE